MNLLERSRAIATEVSELAALRAIADQAEAVRSRATQFENELAKLRLVAGCIRQLRGRGVRVDAEIATVAGVRQFIDALLHAVNADPAAILEIRDVQPRILSPLGKISASLQNAANQGWARQVGQRLPAVSGALLEALARVPALRPKVEHFRVLREQARARSATAPLTQAEFDRMDILIEQCNRAWRDLDAEGIPQDVLVFFREAANARGASLSMLKSDVLAWLEKYGLMDAFGIHIR